MPPGRDLSVAMRAPVRLLLTVALLPLMAVASEPLPTPKTWAASISINHPDYHEHRDFVIKSGQHRWANNETILKSPQSVVTSITTGKDRVVYAEDISGTRMHLFVEPEQVDRQKIVAIVEVALPYDLQYQGFSQTRPQMTRHSAFMETPLSHRGAFVGSAFIFKGKPGWIQVSIKPVGRNHP